MADQHPAKRALRPAQPPAATPAPDEVFDDAEPGVWRDLLRGSPSWLTSLIVHMGILLVLALWILPKPVLEVANLLETPPGEVEDREELDRIDTEIEPLVIDPTVIEKLPDPEPASVDELSELPDAIDEIEPAVTTIETPGFEGEILPEGDVFVQHGDSPGDNPNFDGRSAEGRRRGARIRGGTPGSEEAVAKALRWLALHQLEDGSWRLDHRGGLCQGRCPDPGRRDSANAATALALLPFLGAGETHQEGDYRKNVNAGLEFLKKNLDRRDGSFNDGGQMYAHGLAAIALCEAYGMTQDRTLAGPAQAALDFITVAQDPLGGGWRYQPRQAGDTSVVGWQLMALKSGHMAYLRVPPATVKRANDFLDSVQTDSGAAYGYAGPGAGNATSAIGLLCRMYLGWKRDNAALERGVERLAAAGPSDTNLYYNYYATQVLFQYTSGRGDLWKKWNTRLRDHLVATQAKAGHAAGSWHLGADHSSNSGGRLYSTAMAAMILEVYYRHMPIYRAQAVEEDFPE